MNSRKTIDITFRKAYCQEAGMDELLHYTGWRITESGLVYEWPGKVEQPRDGIPFDPHHIGHRGAKRDFRTNLLFIPRRTHDLIHFGRKGQPVYGVILCLWAKILKRDKTGNPEEFELPLLDECFGQSVLGWCELAQVPDCLRETQGRLVWRLSKMALELEDAKS